MAVDIGAEAVCLDCRAGRTPPARPNRTAERWAKRLGSGVSAKSARCRRRPELLLYSWARRSATSGVSRLDTCGATGRHARRDPQPPSQP